MMQAAISQGEIEDRIMSLVERLEEVTEEYAESMRVAADMEANYKFLAASARIKLAASSSERKMTAAEREARIEVDTDGQFREWKLAEAQRHAHRESLLSLRSMLDAYRTISANVRAQT